MPVPTCVAECAWSGGREDVEEVPVVELMYHVFTGLPGGAIIFLCLLILNLDLSLFPVS